jgi:hypothetical protein
MKRRCRRTLVGSQLKRGMRKAIPHQFLCKAIGPALVMAAWDQAAQAQTYDFNYSGASQNWVVPTTGVYTITAFGAQGGTAGFSQTYQSPYSDGFGGLGAKIGGDFDLTMGQVLSIAVGGQGLSGWYGGGGGGGSFVTLAGNPLVIAGGGGGGSWAGFASGGFSGGTGGNGRSGVYGGIGGTGGTGGIGGGGGAGDLSGGGGGGLYSSGLSGTGFAGGTGGSGFLSGLAGGSGPYGAIGGFGGGGGGYGGGGGGFSGGGGGGNYNSGGGGGSFNSGLNPTGVAGFQSGNGLVQATLIPEPTSLGLLGMGLSAGAVGFAARRRRSRVGNDKPRTTYSTRPRELCRR